MHRIASIVLSLLFLAPTTFAAPNIGVLPPESLPYIILPENVALFRPDPFTPDFARRVRATLQKIADLKPRGLILDMRNHEGGSADGLHALLEGLLPKGTPYMRFYTSNVRRLAVTRQAAVFKKSTPVVVVRNERTLNEADIVVYVMQKLRKAGIMEFTPSRDALKKLYKQNVRMEDFRPIKESVFYVKPDIRMIADEGAKDSDVIPRAVSFIRELSPWEETRETR